MRQSEPLLCRGPHSVAGGVSRGRRGQHRAGETACQVWGGHKALQQGRVESGAHGLLLRQHRPPTLPTLMPILDAEGIELENKRIHPVLSVEAEYVILIPYLSPYRSPLVENACYQTLKKIKYSNPVPHCSFRTLDSIFSQKGTHSKLFEISFLVFRGIIISFSLENLREHEFERAK